MGLLRVQKIVPQSAGAEGLRGLTKEQLLDILPVPAPLYSKVPLDERLLETMGWRGSAWCLQGRLSLRSDPG